MCKLAKGSYCLIVSLLLWVVLILIRVMACFSVAPQVAACSEEHEVEVTLESLSVRAEDRLAIESYTYQSCGILRSASGLAERFDQSSKSLAGYW
jgi:hypothetical protein